MPPAATPEQLPLGLPHRSALGRDAFFVAEPNARAVAQIDAWSTWPQGRIALIGPEGAGKSHLAAVWAVETGAEIATPETLPPASATTALVVDNADRVAGQSEPEQRLFHLLNAIRAAEGHILLVGRTPPARWPVTLPDLASRLASITLARIDGPDDTLLAALLVKLFADRQIAVSPDLITYAVRHMERSFAAAQTLVATLDARALATGRPIGRKLAAEVLDETGDEGA